MASLRQVGIHVKGQQSATVLEPLVGASEYNKRRALGHSVISHLSGDGIDLFEGSK